MRLVARIPCFPFGWLRGLFLLHLVSVWYPMLLNCLEFVILRLAEASKKRKLKKLEDEEAGEDVEEAMEAEGHEDGVEEVEASAEAGSGSGVPHVEEEDDEEEEAEEEEEHGAETADEGEEEEAEVGEEGAVAVASNAPNAVEPAHGAVLEYKDITELLNLPQIVAAKRLNLPMSTLSKRWKEAVRIRKWPYRQVAKLDKEIMTLLHNIPPRGEGEASVTPPEIEQALGVLLRRRQEELRPVRIRL